MKKILVPSLLSLTILSGCTLSPDYVRPDVPLPEKWNISSELIEQESTIPADWWKKYNSEELNQLVETALAQNTDLRAAVQRIEQARANTVIAGSALLPQSDLSGSGSRTRDMRANRTSPYSYNAGLGIGYELDLFGKNRSNSDAADERLKGTEFDRDALALVTVADTAQSYIQLLTLSDRIRIAEENLANGREVLKIADARYKEGATSALEVSQQRASLASTEASLASLRQQRDATRNQLAVLTGQAPQGFAIKGTSTASLTLPKASLVQPATLLERRPDIKTAESDLKAANIDIGAARAAFFPSLNIGLDASVSGIGSNPAAIAAALVGSAAQPIFHGGAIAAGVDSAKARKEEVAANYGGVVLNAYREVEDALSAVKSARERVEAGLVNVEQSQRAFDIAKARYQEGATDFQAMLDTQRSLFSAQDGLAQAKADEINASVELYRSLGGGFKV